MKDIKNNEFNFKILRVLDFTTLTVMEVAYLTTYSQWGLALHLLMELLTVGIVLTCPSKKRMTWGRGQSIMQLIEMRTAVGL